MTDILIPPDTTFACDCGESAHPDDTIVLSGSGEIRCADCATTCDDCGDADLRDDMLSDRRGDTYCTECRTACYDCDSVIPSGDTITDYAGREFCTDCRYACAECGDVGLPEDAHMPDWSTSQYCGDCIHYCDDCDNYSAGDSCDNNCGGDISGLRDYGHTHPSTWLGGPLPRVNGHHDGYYLGFELEISAESGDAGVVENWSYAALGVDAFECKEDSSVEGFEIASQPMTREYIETALAPVLGGLFTRLEDEFGKPYDDEPSGHGIHVHISRTAFRDGKGNESPTMLAAFCRILASDDGTHLERIGRRHQTEYCRKVDKPVSSALLSSSSAWSHRRNRRVNAEMERRYQESVMRAGYESIRYHDRERQRRNIADTIRDELGNVNLSRGAINLNNSSTVEIRAFKSTRKPENLLAALRLVSDAADYVRWLARHRKPMSSSATSWSAFCRWVAMHDPDMFDVVTGLRAMH